ncbi:NmrA family transcriptional regulator [Streptomyces cinnamoneus]|uniref:NmrA family transcriptional regulator n=1 Tax=Streptomyces cinnamoneus TaxID=53446 RepID=A0A2G1XDX8_STRCJ|nr:NAD(P)H-binding protein [Streptomyces cinnamoneus]PHQ49415.1 NmrA family transcriptional regulator [Streptomyces cinnamoneus]PPT14935.1 NmrA family transcriptional regulator [Streptomyces cinnamoneus]
MILVTGATGALGQLVAEKLAARDDVVLGTRSPRSGAERRVDFDDPASLDFTGVDTLLLISAGYGEDDAVIARHEAAVSAAERGGVRHVVYTSLSGDGDHLAYALAHRWTERRLRRSSLEWTILRNGLYAEFLAAVAAPGPDGTIAAPLGEGRLAAVAREDLAEVAARVVTDPRRHAGRVYELVGEQPLGGADLAAAVGGSYEPGGLAATREAVIAAGQALPFQVPMLVGTYSAIAGGFLDGTAIEHNSLRELLGREPQSALKVYAAAVAQSARAS